MNDRYEEIKQLLTAEEPAEGLTMKDLLEAHKSIVDGKRSEYSRAFWDGYKVCLQDVYRFIRERKDA